ncbi:hypothetical protein GCM10010435_75650 [Winogradskya consettensis]|uniref:Uncharacterized protein n=1 Tax=Winogradskya consettensis TaxID=113560 RepID=A0A919T195_9ACTN|nr:hypothetical protein Aco04nite_75430 [Actinoplanes consettensis]
MGCPTTIRPASALPSDDATYMEKSCPCKDCDLKIKAPETAIAQWILHQRIWAVGAAIAALVAGWLGGRLMASADNNTDGQFSFAVALLGFGLTALWTASAMTIGASVRLETHVREIHKSAEKAVGTSTAASPTVTPCSCGSQAATAVSGSISLPIPPVAAVVRLHVEPTGPPTQQ